MLQSGMTSALLDTLAFASMIVLITAIAILGGALMGIAIAGTRARQKFAPTTTPASANSLQRSKSVGPPRTRPG